MRTIDFKFTNPLETQAGDPIEKVTLREPDAGALRGLKLVDLMQLDVVSLHALIPRISEPHIDKVTVKQISLPDLAELGGELLDFFDPRSS